MRDVILDESFRIEYQVSAGAGMTPIAKNAALHTDGVYDIRVAPAHHFKNMFRYPHNTNIEDQDLFIAYSADVQELLELPFDCLSNQLTDALEEQQALKTRLTAATLWQRLKFLFLKRLT